MNKCKNCGVDVRWSYCSTQCQHAHKWEEKKKLIESNHDFGGYRERQHHQKGGLIRRYLLEKDPSCSNCNLTEWQGQPIKLQLDHIDGVPKHNWLSNCRLLCPNCHSMTDTYMNSKRV